MNAFYKHHWDSIQCHRSNVCALQIRRLAGITDNISNITHIAAALNRTFLGKKTSSCGLSFIIELPCTEGDRELQAWLIGRTNNSHGRGLPNAIVFIRGNVTMLQPIAGADLNRLATNVIREKFPSIERTRESFEIAR